MFNFRSITKLLGNDKTWKNNISSKPYFLIFRDLCFLNAVYKSHILFERWFSIFLNLIISIFNTFFDYIPRLVLVRILCLFVFHFLENLLVVMNVKYVHLITFLSKFSKLMNLSKFSIQISELEQFRETRDFSVYYFIVGRPGLGCISVHTTCPCTDHVESQYLSSIKIGRQELV